MRKNVRVLYIFKSKEGRSLIKWLNFSFQNHKIHLSDNDFKLLIMFGLKGLTYFINGKLYLALTNRCNAANSITVRGPSFQWGKDFVQLPRGFEPSADMLSTAVHDAFKGGHITNIEKETEELITFAGYGEPLLCYDVLCEAAAQIKQTSSLYSTSKPVSLRVKTNGLIAPYQCTDMVNRLKLSGIDKVSSVDLLLAHSHFIYYCPYPLDVSLTHSVTIFFDD